MVSIRRNPGSKEGHSMTLYITQINASHPMDPATRTHKPYIRIEGKIGHACTSSFYLTITQEDTSVKWDLMLYESDTAWPIRGSKLTRLIKAYVNHFLGRDFVLSPNTSRKAVRMHWQATLMAFNPFDILADVRELLEKTDALITNPG